MTIYPPTTPYTPSSYPPSYLRPAHLVHKVAAFVCPLLKEEEEEEEEEEETLVGGGGSTQLKAPPPPTAIDTRADIVPTSTIFNLKFN